MEIAYREIAKGNLMRPERNFQIFTSEESFKPFRPGSVESRKIHWADEVVIGLFSGNKPTGGYSITVSQIETAPPLLKIYFEEVSPRPGTIVTQSVTFPGLVIAVKQKDLPEECLTAQFITNGKVVKEQKL